MPGILDRFRLGGKVAIVTGASRGIGRSIAVGLAEAGADVVAASRTLTDVQAVAEEIAQLGRRSLALKVDVSQQPDVEGLLQHTLEAFHRVDILVNNAGISPYYKSMHKMTKEEWDLIVSVNLTGVFLGCNIIGNEMIKQQQGKIINISSVGGEVALPRLSAYSACKGGIDQLTRTLAIEWARYHVLVNAVLPAFIETDMTTGLRVNDVLREEIISKTPLGRFGRPEEIIGAVVFLASPAADFITGTCLNVDGGWMAQ
ncbi:MAG: SDR family oxidoreductase [Candidatus Tectomicrobia bacterium]|uniref:SDR family oxidoreductase n=1 Tax=Tectimicrobiota bacterium TaxID=2528274 RepID=A0A932CMP1_UNCTE|nr:SDR family oxidoreductase [Candidatus Tectomicrobia bacterium]